MKLFHQDYFMSHLFSNSFNALSNLSLALVLTLMLSGSQVHGQQHWWQWRGPQANGVASEGNPPISWSEQENVRWKVAIPGKGHASPVIWGDRLFLLTAVAESAPQVDGLRETTPPAPQAEGRDRQRGSRRGGGGGRGGFGGNQPEAVKHSFQTICLDKNTGEQVWSREGMAVIPHEGHHPTNSYSSGSAITDGKHVISYFGSRGLFVYDMMGNLVWQKDLGDMPTRNGFGEGASPALLDDILVVLWDTESDSYIVAYNKLTGEERWRQVRDERTGWTTPVILDHQGRRQVVVNATNKVRSYDLETGELLWECGGQTANAIPTVVADEQHVYALSGYRGSTAMAIRLGQRGDLTDSDAIAWSLNRGTPYVPSPLLMSGRLWFTQGNDAVLSCVEASTGKVHYSQERLEGPSGFYASPVGVAGRVYLTGRDGTTVVIEDSESLKVLATNKLDDPMDASPALSGDAIYLRGHQYLYCIGK